MNPAGDFDYGTRGAGYAGQRRADPRIEALVHRALGDARTVLNVGAGAGSYEPRDRHVLAVEPSAAMRAQRPPHLAPAIAGVAEALPFDDRAIDAAMAIVTIHQWPDVEKGLRELRRVTRGAVVVMTFDPDALERYWLGEYAPELIAAERRRYPRIDTVRACIGGPVRVETIPIPHDCTDGFQEAFYARPEQFLDARVRRSQSAWGFVGADIEARIVRTLAEDLEKGVWDRRHGHWRAAAQFEGSLRLVIGGGAPG